MRFSVDKTEFQNALNIVQKGVTTKSTLPVLSGVLIKAEGNNITLQATDLELSIQYISEALVEEEGSVVVPAKLFVDIIKNMPDAAIHIYTEGLQANIQCDNSSFSVKVLNYEDFPSFPKVDTDESLIVDFEDFSSMVKRVYRNVSHDESRMILTGVLIEANESSLKMVATDSYRLAITEIQKENITSSFNAVIDGSFLNEIASLPQKEKDIEISASENQILITYGKITFINRRIEGSYPNYKQLLPSSYRTTAVIDREDLIQGVKRASILCTKNSPMKFNISSATQSLCLSVSTVDVGAVQETILCNIEGEDLDVAYNSAYFLDGLNVSKSKQVTLKLQEYPKPGIIESSDDEGFIYLIMPMRS
jgi:DNA polymerase-3 subunit beta